MDSVRVVVQDIEVGMFSATEMGLSVTIQGKSINEVNTFNVPYTKTIKLPLTETLSLALKNPQEIDSKGSVSLKEYFTIRIYINGYTNVYGWIKPIRTVIDSIQDYIEFSIQPRQKTWVEQMELFDMCDLDLSDLNHELTVSNIRASESGTNPYVYAPTDIAEISRLPVLRVELIGTDLYYYYYGEQSTGNFIAHAYGFSNSGLYMNWQEFADVLSPVWNTRGIFIAKTVGRVFGSTQTYNQSGYLYIERYSWQVGDFYPYISFTTLVERAFSRIGYQVEIPDLNDYLYDKYHYQHDIELLNQLATERTDNDKFRVRVYDGGYTFTKSAADAWKMPFYKADDFGYVQNVKYTDTGNDVQATIDASSNVSRFTATENTILRFEWNVDVLYELSIFYGVQYTDLNFKINHYNSSNSLLASHVNETPYIPFGASQQYRFKLTLSTGYVYLQTGDYVECLLSFVARTGSSCDITIESANTFESFEYKGGNFKGKTIRLNEYLPRENALKWLKDLSFINNWQFYTNEALKKVYIVRDDKKQSGKKLDYTKKIDRSRGIEIEDICALHPKTYKFNWNKDKNDWSVDYLEIVSGERFAKGEITNLNLFTSEVQGVSCEIYAASLDKFESSGILNFDTIEMKSKEQWPSLPGFKRTDYKPRYVRLVFNESLESHGLYGATGIAYSIEGDATPLRYVRPEFQLDLHFGGATGLLKTKYFQFARRLNYGQIVRAYLLINETDTDSYMQILKEDNDFRADYSIQIKGNVVEAEMNKIIDYGSTLNDVTQAEFIIFKDET